MSEAPKLKKSLSDVFNALDQQEIRKLVDIVGIYARGAVEEYEYEGKSGKTGFIQVLTKSRKGSKRLSLDSIKVREDCYGLIDLLNDQKSLQPIRVRCEIVEFGQRSSTYLVADQPHLKLEPAASVA